MAGATSVAIWMKADYIALSQMEQTDDSLRWTR